jgi:threonine/homoserine/homoserine lactone efflux protein
MNMLDFGIEVIALSASGVLAPGPLFFANLVYGTRHDKWSGIKVAYGHTAVELPLIIMLAAGLFTFDSAKKYVSVVGLVGGIAILAFAGLQIATILKEKRGYDMPSLARGKGPFIMGVALSALEVDIGLSRVWSHNGRSDPFCTPHLDGLRMACQHRISRFQGSLCS